LWLYPSCKIMFFALHQPKKLPKHARSIKTKSPAIAVNFL